MLLGLLWAVRCNPDVPPLSQDPGCCCCSGAHHHDWCHLTNSRKDGLLSIMSRDVSSNQVQQIAIRLTNGRTSAYKWRTSLDAGHLVAQVLQNAAQLCHRNA